ncbi:MAG: hypothetical protein ACOYJF_04385 [Prevotella sp.]|jgi:Spy/CpxP family protein refolding chaperone
MKKIMLMFMMLASMTAAMAQKPTQKKSMQKQPAVVQILDESSFDDLDLTSTQQKKVRTLNNKYKSKSRSQNQQQYNKELKKVLSTTQYNKFTSKKVARKNVTSKSKSKKKIQKRAPRTED